MLAFIYLPVLLLAPLSSLARSSDPGASHGKRYYPWNNVQWVTPLKSVKADSVVELQWRGGSGNGYEVYFVPQWDRQDVFEVRLSLPQHATPIRFPLI